VGAPCEVGKLRSLQLLLGALGTLQQVGRDRHAGHVFKEKQRTMPVH
jgi:hypothetical protein